MTESRCCYTCTWYRTGMLGICANPLIGRLEGQYGLYRVADESCALWAPKQKAASQGCAELSDEDLAEADRQARTIKEARK